MKVTPASKSLKALIVGSEWLGRGQATSSKTEDQASEDAPRAPSSLVEIAAKLAADTPDAEKAAKEEEEALELLKFPDLLGRILEDFDACGIVGEATNKLTGYLACVSRKLDKPLAVIRGA